jgi:Methyltransferase FkbM domain
MAPGAAPEAVIEVSISTLDSVLEEAGAPVGFDFLSIDVEGHELDVLRGINLARWCPRLILLEDHVPDLSKHRYLNAAGYRIIRRYGNNGWYVPRASAGTIGWSDRWGILRKYYLALPVRRLRNVSRRLRKGQG